jgi:hypothetical protein
MEYAEAMTEPGMCGAGIDKVCWTKLFDPVEILERFFLNDSDESRGEIDMFPYRVAYWFGIIFFEVS